MIDKKPEVRKFTVAEAAWLAGVVDGEGSIGLYNYGKEGRRVCVQMSNTNEAFVQEMRRIIGCGSNVVREYRIRKNPLSKSHLGDKQMYLYSLKGSARCYWVLTQIARYLIIKKRKALNIIDELESKPFGRWAAATPESKKNSIRSHKGSVERSWNTRKKTSRNAKG